MVAAWQGNIARSRERGRAPVISYLLSVSGVGERDTLEIRGRRSENQRTKCERPESRGPTSSNVVFSAEFKIKSSFLSDSSWLCATTIDPTPATRAVIPTSLMFFYALFF